MKKVLGIAAIGALAFTLSACSVEQKAAFDSLKATPSAEETQTAATEQTPEETEEPKTENTLAADVKKTALENNAVEEFVELGESSPGFAITEIENVNTETVRVHIQETLNDEAAEASARWLINMSCAENPALNGVVIRDASGIDRNFYAARLTTVCS